MVYPPVHPFSSLTILVKKTLSDIEFLAKKEFDGKLRTAEGTLTATGDLATITANSGKDMYLAKTKVSVRQTTSDRNSRTVIVELKVNAVIKSTWSCDLNAQSTTIGATSSIGYEFVLSGVKVAATQIIKLEVITIDADMEVNGELVVFEETTGETPVI